MKTTIYFIRHGQTAMNKLKRYCGRLDAVLNDTGRRQARDLSRRLCSEVINKIYASDRKRAIETARIALRGRGIERMPALQEINFGVFEGLSHKGILKRFPDAYQCWLKDPFKTVIPRGESLNDFEKRIRGAVERIVADNRGKTIAVFTHGGSISVYFNRLRKTKDFWENIPHSASLSIVEYNGRSPRVVVFDDRSYLKE